MRIFDSRYSLCGFPSTRNRKDGDLVFIDSPYRRTFRYKSLSYFNIFPQNADFGDVLGVSSGKWSWLKPNVPFPINAHFGDIIVAGRNGQPIYYKPTTLPTPKDLTDKVLGVSDGRLSYVNSPAGIGLTILPNQYPTSNNGKLEGRFWYDLPTPTLSDTNKFVTVEQNHYVLKYTKLPITHDDAFNVIYGSDHYTLQDNRHRKSLPDLPEPANNIVSTQSDQYITTDVRSVLGLPKLSDWNRILSIVNDSTGNKKLAFIKMNDFTLPILTDGVLGDLRIVLTDPNTVNIPPFKYVFDRTTLDIKDSTLTIDRNKVQYFVIDMIGNIRLVDTLPEDKNSVIAVNLRGTIYNVKFDISHLAQQIADKFINHVDGDVSVDQQTRYLSIQANTFFGKYGHIDTNKASFRFADSNGVLSASLDIFPTAPLVELTKGHTSTALHYKVYVYPIYILPDLSVIICYADKEYNHLNDVYNLGYKYSYTNVFTEVGVHLGDLIVDGNYLYIFNENTLDDIQEDALYVYNKDKNIIEPSIPLFLLHQNLDIDYIIQIHLALKKTVVSGWTGEHSIFDNIISYGVDVSNSMEIQSPNYQGLRISQIVNFAETIQGNSFDYNNLKDDCVCLSTRNSIFKILTPVTLNNISHAPIEISFLSSELESNLTLKKSHVIPNLSNLTPTIEFDFYNYPTGAIINIGKHVSGSNLITDPCVRLSSSNSLLKYVEFQSDTIVKAHFNDGTSVVIGTNLTTLKLPITIDNVNTDNLTISFKNIYVRFNIGVFLSTPTNTFEKIYDLGTLNNFITNSTPYFKGNSSYDISKLTKFIVFNKKPILPSQHPFDILDQNTIPTLILVSSTKSTQCSLKLVHSPRCVEYGGIIESMNTKIYLRLDRNIDINNISLLISN